MHPKQYPSTNLSPGRMIDHACRENSLSERSAAMVLSSTANEFGAMPAKIASTIMLVNVFAPATSFKRLDTCDVEPLELLGNEKPRVRVLDMLIHRGNK